MKEILISVFNLYRNIATILVTIAIIVTLYFIIETGKSYAIIMKNETDFIGERIRISNTPEKVIYDDTRKIILLDKQYDDNNGRFKGKIRWIKCTNEYSSKSSCKRAGDY